MPQTPASPRHRDSNRAAQPLWPAKCQLIQSLEEHRPKNMSINIAYLWGYPCHLAVAPLADTSNTSMIPSSVVDEAIWNIMCPHQNYELQFFWNIPSRKFNIEPARWKIGFHYFPLIKWVIFWLEFLLFQKVPSPRGISSSFGVQPPTSAPEGRRLPSHRSWTAEEILEKKHPKRQKKITNLLGPLSRDGLIALRWSGMPPFFRLSS